MGFIETVGATVATALVVGLTVLSIRKPRQYRRLQPFLFAMLGLAWMLTMAYVIGADLTEAAMKPFLRDGEHMAALQAVSAVQPNGVYLVVAGMLIGAFMGLLGSLPLLLGISEDGDDQDDGQKKP